MENLHLIHETIAVLAIIIIAAKLFSFFSIKMKQPPVLGMLFIGLVLGPSGLKLFHSNVIFQFLSNIGVIFLLFLAGLETDIPSMKRSGKSSLIIALGGVFLPLGAGIGAGLFFKYSILSSFLIGLILTATSVSVTVMSLIDMKKLRSVEGTTILGAAIIDDVIGILLLTFVFSFSGPQGNVWLSMAKILGYLGAAILFGMFLINPIIQMTRKLKLEQGVLSIALALCLLYAWSAEKAQIAAITGAYLAGLFLGQTNAKTTIMEGVETLGQSLFVSVFFINIGLETELWEHEINYGFTAIFLAIAVFSKILGSGIGARASGFSWNRSLGISFGMIPRGEVALIIAQMALTKGLLGASEFSTTVMMVVTTALITPFLLKWSFAEPSIQK